MAELDGMGIVVTGASGNLGAATAKALLREGARVALMDRSAEAAVHAMGGALSAGNVVLPVDLTDEAATAVAFASAREKLGRLDGVVCTVGGYVGGSPLTDTRWETFEKMFAMNVKTAFTANLAAIAAFGERGGSIVNVASMAALQGTAGESAYAATKSALLRMVESLAAETKGKGIRVNAVLPGTIDTPQNRAWMSESMARLAIDPAAIADVIAFLLSPRARAVTGAAIRVTGAQ
jgi:NAD(P)-dependent dehydrogenase (short-subunit alcohol dehydrogenase family)